MGVKFRIENSVKSYFYFIWKIVYKHYLAGGFIEILLC